MRLLRMKDAIDRWPGGRSSYYEKVKCGLLPPPVRVAGRMSAVPEHELDRILAAWIAGYSDDEVRELVRQIVAERGREAGSEVA